MATSTNNALRTDLLRYWRNSLADIERKEVTSPSVVELGRREFQDGVAPPSVLVAMHEQWTRSKAKQNKSGDTSDEVPSALPVLITPIVMRARRDHGRSRAIGASVLYPLWIPAMLSSEGGLTPAPERLPWVARQFLEPNGGFEIAVGTVDEVDTFLTMESDKALPASWADTLSYADRMWTHITGTSLSVYSVPGFLRQEPGICLDTESRGITEPLLSLFDKVQTGNQPTPLLDRFCANLVRPPASSNPALDQNKRHLGHVSGNPLTSSQRLGLHATLALSETNDVLAINGPPGTGKTTLLQSIIASLWVDAAIQGSEPPVILVTSTNNRAVGNVIESFERAADLPAAHPLAGRLVTKRWLPNVQGYGLSLRSRTAPTTPQSTTRETSPQGPRWTDFVEMTEDPSYVGKASRSFLEAFREYGRRNATSVAEAVEELHRQLRAAAAAQHRLAESERVLRQLAHNLGKAVGASSFESTTDQETGPALSHIAGLLDELKAQVERARGRRDDGRVMRDEIARVAAPKGLIELVFRFIPAVRAQSWIRARAVLEKHNFRRLLDQYASKPPTYAELTAQLNRYVSQQDASLSKAENAHATLQRAEREWRSQAEALVGKYQESNSDQEVLSDFDRLERFLDTHLRVEMFHLAGRYWEGRWLLEMQDLELKLDRQNRESCEARFRRFAKLTPCMVATPFMAARYFDYFDGKSNPLTDFLDLLIVDEAGQVRPDIGIPIFALAKRAVVVGDIYQIEPVWEQPLAVDSGNIGKMGLSRFADALEDTGSRVSNGNLMRMARHASYYNLPNDRGVFLAEHFRCLETIISYCNELTYGGRLVPSRQDIGSGLLPAMGFAHIDSPCERHGGSWANPGEARTIAEWLLRHQPDFLDAYPAAEQLGDIVAVVTPFRAQAGLIQEALERAGLGQDQIVVGTVHAMQGGERPIIIFSPALSPTPTGAYFFDRGPNMLNVAVSRAKDSFLAFGNAGLFDAQTRKPSGLLSKWLFANPENEITDVDTIPRFPAREQDTTESIQSLTKHRYLLSEALSKAREKVLIVSPYISIRAFEADDLIPAFASAVDRGVVVKVLVGSDMDLEPNGSKRENAARAIEALRDVHVDVIELPRIHNKTLAVDELWFVEGSFNWLSAVRDDTSRFQRVERSLAFKGPSAADHIRKLWEELEAI